MPLTEAVKQLHRRGLAHLNAQEAAAAIPIFREVLTHTPDSIDTWDHLAAALTMHGAYAEAEDAFQMCFKLGCTFPETLHNAVRNAGFWNKPLLQYEHAKRLLNMEGELRHAGLRYAVEALRGCGRPLDALAACKQLLLEVPEEFSARQLCLRPLLETGQTDAAATLCGQLLAQQPDNRSLCLTRIEALIANGDMEGGLRHAEALLESDPDNLDAMSALGFHYQFMADMTVAARRTHAQRFGDAVRRRGIVPYQHSGARDGERPLRVGLVSGDLRKHPVGFFLQSVMESLQASSLQFFVYDCLARHDAVSSRIRPLAARWQEVQGMHDAQLAELIRNDGIDILLDVQGYMTGNRLAVFAHKPAPVQLSWMGFQGTTGTPGIDYVLVDKHCVPEGAEAEFIEKVWRLPEHTLCFTPPEVDCPVVPPPVLANGYITFGSLNNLHKLNDKVLALWAAVLAGIPDARLLLKGSGFHSPAYRAGFVQRLEARGFDIQRVSLEPPAPRAQFLQTYNRIDIALDPFPCSGATTTAEALWAGVPVLALRGDRMVWRMATSLLTACGLQDWLAATPGEFVALAQAKAADIGALTTLRAIQRTQVTQSPLCDAPRFAAMLEQSLRDIWRERLSRMSS